MEFLVAQLLNGLVCGMLLFLMTVGFSLIFGLMNLMSLPHGSFSILVEQNLRTALAVTDRHHVTNKGEICFTGTSAELEVNELVLRNSV
jgi:branched-subunit amino acid ABC-type transport system permease component